MCNCTMCKIFLSIRSFYLQLFNKLLWIIFAVKVPLYSAHAEIMHILEPPSLTNVMTVVTGTNQLIPPAKTSNS